MDNIVEEIREDVKFIRDKVISHETKLEHWFGNGQPGVMSNVLEDLEELKSLKWKLIGIGLGLIIVMEGVHTGASKLLEKLF